MDGYVSDSSEVVIRSRKRRRLMAISSDSSDSNQSESDFEWEEKNDKPKVHKFTSVGGVNGNIKNFTRQNVYHLFLTNDILEHIVTETNRFGEEDPSFKEISVEELEVYFALNILMSMVQKPTLQSYWSTDKSIETPYFKTVMSRNRFMAISRKLHFVDNERLQPDDPLRKIRPIMDMINKRFKEVCTPNRDISLDESLMKCRSRISHIQYNKTKRARFGIKYYKLCDSRTKYIHNFRVYVGKDKCKKGLASTKIVLDMMKESNLLEKGHCLYIDNWYSSPDLYNKLYKLKTNVCGTVRTNRKQMPKALESKKLKLGEAAILQCKNISAIKWKDKKDVNMLSTMHNLEFSDSGKQNYKTKENIVKPTVVLDYNKNMGGVDGGDQLLSKFHTMRRYHKVYKKEFFYCLDMILLNSYIVYKTIYKDRAFHVFKQKLAEEILEKNIPKINTQQKKRTITPCLSLPGRFRGQHFPILIETNSSKKARKRCVVCLSEKKEKIHFINVITAMWHYALTISNIIMLCKIIRFYSSHNYEYIMK